MSQFDDVQELPPQVVAQGELPSTEEKPAVQIANESLTNETATGYAKHYEPNSEGYAVDPEPIDGSTEPEVHEGEETPVNA